MAATALAAVPLRNIPTAVVPYVISGTDASTTVLAGLAGYQIDVWGYDLFTNGITDLQLKSGSTDIAGIMGFGGSSGPSYVGWEPPTGAHKDQLAIPRCVTADGENLVLTNSGSVRIGGTIWLVQRRSANLN